MTLPAEAEQPYSRGTLLLPHASGNRYELVCSRDASLSVDPMTMMESLKSKKKKKKKNADGSDWTWKELSDLVKFTPVTYLSS